MNKPYDQTLALLHSRFGLPTAQAVENFINSRHLCSIASIFDQTLSDTLYAAAVQMLANSLQTLHPAAHEQISLLILVAVRESDAEPMPLRLSPYTPTPEEASPINPEVTQLLQAIR